MKVAEMLNDIEFLLGQLKLVEWTRDIEGIEEIEQKYFPKVDSFYEGRARRDNMSNIGELDYDT